MNRRRLLQALLATPAVLLAGSGVRQPVMARTTSPPLTLQRSPLAGFQYHAGERVWPKLLTGDSVSLVREPLNRYDARAVAVYWRGHKLGYVPRNENTAVAWIMDHGERQVQARIVRLKRDRDPWERVELLIDVVV